MPVHSKTVCTASDPADPGASLVRPTQREAQNHQDAELVRVAAYTGLRLGELLALRWGDIDFAGGQTVERARSAPAWSPAQSRARCDEYPSPTRLPAR